MSDTSSGVEHSFSFGRTFLLPALWVLLLPIASYWFTSHQLGNWSKGLQRSTIRFLQKKGKKPNAAQLAYIKRLDIGELAFRRCGTFGFFNSSIPKADQRLCSAPLQFAWGRRLGIWLLLFALFAAITSGLGLLWARRSPMQQHRGFRLGWSVLRWFGVAHIVGQGVLSIFLSFWLTAIWFNIYIPKLIVIAVCIAGYAAFASIKALFATSPDDFKVHGLVLEPSDAPEFFAHIGELADKIGTEPPSHVVVGVDDNFFVTEAPFSIHEHFPGEQHPHPAEQSIEGRALFVSLPLMRILERDELDGVLAHELAHFVAGDTAQLSKLNMQFKAFDSYMGQLAESFTWGVASCMVAFRALFELITQEHSRVAEFHADQRAADATSAESISHSLLKIAAYSGYRHKTESEILEEMSKQQNLQIGGRVKEGFAAFLEEDAFRETVLQEAVPHPFDSHPPLRERLQQLGVSLELAQVVETLQEEPDATWCDAIPVADALEARLWRAYEELFQAQHEFLIALRLRPTNDEEREHVASFFPPVELYGKTGEREATVSWWGLTLKDGETVDFDDIRDLEKRDGVINESLVVQLKRGGSHKIKLVGAAEIFLGALNERWQRHHIALSEAEESASEENE
jgi:Zn-dependent protease with chaperone function